MIIVFSNIQLLSSFQRSGFKQLWISTFLESLSWNVQNVLVSWLVLEITNSSFLLGVIMALNFAPRAFGLIAGVLADRVDRRKLLIFLGAIQIVASLALGILIVGGQIEFWHIALIPFIGSTLMSFSQPTSSAFTVDLVGKDEVTNATALNRLCFFAAGIVGPSLVGAFVNKMGIGSFFYLNAVFFTMSIFLILSIKRTSETKVLKKEKSILKDLVEGLKYSWENKIVFAGEWIYLITNIFMWPCNWTLMPIFIRNVLQADASGLGWLSTANRIGGFVATLGIASLGKYKSKGKLLIISSLGWGLSWILFALTVWIPLSIVSLFIIGFTGSLTMTLASVLLLINSSQDMRGRVMGIQTLAISSQSPGSLFAGFAAQTFGSSFAISAEAILFILSMLMTIKIVPSLIKAE
jgi:MFS family permease